MLFPSVYEAKKKERNRKLKVMQSIEIEDQNSLLRIQASLIDYIHHFAK